MRMARFSRDYEVQIDDAGNKRIWPAGWSGEVDNAIATAAEKVGAAELDPVPKGAGSVKTSSAVELPADWQSLGAAELVALAHKLGAGEDVKTKAAATDYVAAIAADRRAE